jgi:hypothetical protein
MKSKPKTMPAAAVEITELSQLERISHGAPLIVDVPIRGKVVRLTGRRLKPAENVEIKLLLERALPPLLPPEKEGEQPRYDFRDPGYLKSAEENRRSARALAIYSAFPVFKAALEKEGGPIDSGRIVQFIENRDIEDDALEVLFNAVIERVVGAPYVGFS